MPKRQKGTTVVTPVDMAYGGKGKMMNSRGMKTGGKMKKGRMYK